MNEKERKNEKGKETKEKKTKKEKIREAEDIRNKSGIKRKSEAEYQAWYIRFEARILLAKLIEEKDWENVALLADAIDKISLVACDLGDAESIWKSNNMKRETQELLEDIRETIDEITGDVEKLD